MRIRSIALALVVLFAGALGGSLLAPPPASGVSREIIQLQQQVAQLIQGQQDLRSALDSHSATLRTLVQQSLDATNGLNGQMAQMQKSVQDSLANSGSRIDSMTQQTQGISDNLQDVQARVGKLAQQLTDMQNLLQSIDAKVSGGVPSGVTAGGPSGAPNAPLPSGTNPGYVDNSAPGMAPAPASGTTSAGGLPPISADTLYQNGLRDFTSGKYDLARQEFSDYLKNFPANDLASNAQFYLGEIDYAQNNFRQAIGEYDGVLQNYPSSYKLSAALLKKAFAELALGMKVSATRDLREVVHRFPGSDESRRAQAKLHEIGASVGSRTTHR